MTAQYSLRREGRREASFFRVIISFGLGPPEVAPYMTETFGEVFGPRIGAKLALSHDPPVNRCQK